MSGRLLVEFQQHELPAVIIDWLNSKDSDLQASVSDWLGGEGLFAILDCASIPNGAELALAWDAPHQSLFSGAAAERTQSYAPLLVELTGNFRALRKLLLPGDRLNGLRGNPGVLLFSSPKGFDQLRQHLRHFTKISDDDGRWYFLRFWDARSAGVFWGAHRDDAAECWRRYRDIIRRITWFDEKHVHCLTVTQPLTEVRPANSVFNSYYRLFDEQEWIRFTGRIHTILLDRHPDLAPDLETIRDICAQAWRTGFRKERAIQGFVTAFILARHLNRDFPTLLDAANRRYQDDVARANLMLEELNLG